MMAIVVMLMGGRRRCIFPQPYLLMVRHLVLFTEFSDTGPSILFPKQPSDVNKLWKDRDILLMRSSAEYHLIFHACEPI